MEDVLAVYSRPYNKAYPVVCMDEKPIQFFADFRKGFRSKRNGVSYEDYQYIRNGTACIFLFTEPLSGWRYADAQERRTRQDWAKQIEWLLTKQYPDAQKVVLVMDNLNTHNIASLYATFPPHYARELAERLEIHYTPKHGSWLNIAEIELSALGRQCIANSRIPDLPLSEHCLCRGLHQETNYRRVLTGTSPQTMPEPSLNICILLSRFRFYEVLDFYSV